MLLRRKFYKNTAIILAAISVFGSSVNTANAYQGVNEVTEISQQISESSLQDGEYKLKNIINKKESVLHLYRAFFAEETKLVVKNSEYYLTFDITKATSVPSMEAYIGQEQLAVSVDNINENEYKFTIKLSDLSSTITMKAMMPGHPMSYDVTLDMDSLEVISLVEPDVTPDIPTQPETPQEPENSETEKEEVVKPQDTQFKDGLYNLSNIVTDHKMPEMIRSIFGEKTSVELKDGKVYLTFNLPNYDYVGEITITVDGKEVKHTQTNSKTSKNATLELEIPSLDSEIKMTMYSPITKKDSVFGVELDKSTMKLASNNEDTNQSTGTTNNSSNSTTNNNNTSNNTTNNNSTSEEVVESVVVEGVRYTIQNEVSADSTTAKNMGRKYLNETSKIEEIDGKTYAVLTFTGLNMMNNHRIYVNGSKVSHQVVSKTDSSVTVKFLIPSVNADIKVQVYVVPMGFDSEFNVKLLKGTEGTKEKFTQTLLPQTGSLLGTSQVVTSGGILAGLGAVLNRRKKRN